MKTNHWVVAIDDPGAGERILVGPFFSPGAAARFAQGNEAAEVLVVVSPWEIEKEQA